MRNTIRNDRWAPSASLHASSSIGHSRSPLLDPANPAEDLISAEDWVCVGTSLHLTALELEVAVLIFQGMRRGAMARRLRVSPSTVRLRMDQLFRKLHVRDRLALVLRIVRVWLVLRAEPAARPGTTSSSQEGEPAVRPCTIAQDGEGAQHR